MSADYRLQSLSPESLTVCRNSDMAAIYGFHMCQYKEIGPALLNIPNSTLKKTITFFDPPSTEIQEKIPRNFLCINPTKNHCKDLLVEIVLENQERFKENRKIIPIIFCIDTDLPTFSPISPIEITYKSALSVTYSEIRRAYKLVTECPKEVCETAKKTFVFVKLITKTNPPSLIPIAPPWEQNGWNEGWATRKSQLFHEPSLSLWRECVFNRENPAFALRLVTKCGRNLQYVSKNLRKSRPIVLTAIHQTVEAVPFASETLTHPEIENARNYLQKMRLTQAISEFSSELSDSFLDALENWDSPIEQENKTPKVSKPHTLSPLAKTVIITTCLVFTSIAFKLLRK
ncbi:MAG: DUF4116 domain-containing protein [Chlamydiota bacterium]